MVYTDTLHSVIKSGTITNPTTLKRVQAIGLLIAALLSLGFRSHAATYTASTPGNFNSETTWKPTYPGNVISSKDTLIINSNVKLNVDVIIRGLMIVRAQGSLTGEKSLVTLDKGIFVNYGTTIVESFTNRGGLINKHILETNKDFINTGKVENNESMVVGNILDNIGIITGNGGNLIANTKFVNAQTGQIVGNIDVCSSNFMNVDGGHLDSTNVSFCGHRIFNSIFLTATLKKESVVLNLLNSQNKHFKEYTIEKSTDGVAYNAVAKINGAEITDETAPFRYADNEITGNNTIFYRIKLLQDDGTEKVIPAVEVGNIQAAKMTARATK